jgi:hypothetical protein
MRHPWRTIAALVLAAAPGAGAQPAAQAVNDPAAARLYDALFGKAERAALATPDRADDRALAAELIKSATDLTVKTDADRAGRLLLLERAYLFSCRDSKAVGTAVRAATLLAQHDPGAAAYWRARIDEINDREARAAVAAGAAGPDWKIAGRARLDKLAADADAEFARREYVRAAYAYRRAAELAVRLGAAGPEARALERQSRVATARVLKRAEAERLAQELTKPGTPADDAAERARAFLLLLDDPDAAADALGPSGDAKLAKIIALARRDAGELTAEQAAELGDWYWSFRDAPAYAASGQVIAGRVSTCLERRIELTSEVPARLHLEAELKSARKRVETIDAPEPRGSATP